MKIAFCKFAGLGSGGIEKYLQSFAKILKDEGHEVDYFYTNAARLEGTSWVHPPNDELRKKTVESWGIKTIPIHVGYRVHNTWHDTDFFDVFDETKYDLLITGGNGEPEFPYDELRNIKIIHTVHGDHVFNQSNIDKSILICNWQAERWLKNGGDESKLKIIPPIVPRITNHPKDFRDKHNIPQDAFLFGMHQRNDPNIFYPVSLLAFEKVSAENNRMVIMGGAPQYKEVASKFSEETRKRIIFLDFCSDAKEIHNFLDSIDVYAHSRLDGEVCSASIIEAMSHSKPVISCPGQNNGHYEQIEGCGMFCNSLDEYAEAMMQISKNKDLYEWHKLKTRSKYIKDYSFESVKNKILKIL